MEPGEVKELGAHPTASKGNVFFTNFDAKPGALFPVYFQYGDADRRATSRFPCSTASLPEYTSLVPPTSAPAEQ